MKPRAEDDSVSPLNPDLPLLSTHSSRQLYGPSKRIQAALPVSCRLELGITQGFPLMHYTGAASGDKLKEMKPRTLILRTAGTNCDQETAYAFERAGSQTEKIHISRLVQEPGLLDSFQLLAIPGGFSYGDDISAGRILANQIVHHLREALARFVESGRPVIGICNGFQVLVKTDLLPGVLGGRSGQTCTLTQNDSGRFIDRWVRLSARGRKCVWTAGLADLDLPIAHGEGKFIPADESVRQALWDRDQVALVYTRADGSPAGGQFPDNPNGSIDDIAGVTDSTGLVLGLMPHPERHVDPIQHPAWASHHPLPAEGAGLRLFRNAVAHVKETVGAGI